MFRFPIAIAGAFALAATALGLIAITMTALVSYHSAFVLALPVVIFAIAAPIGMVMIALMLWADD